MGEHLIVSRLRSDRYIVQRDTGNGSPVTIGEFGSPDKAREHVALTAFELGADPIEVEHNVFALHVAPDTALTHEWTPER